VEHHVARALLQPGEFEHARERHAGPLRDSAPALVALVQRDLGARGQRAQLRERKRERALDQAVHAQSPARELLIEQALVGVRLRHERAAQRKMRRDVGERQLARQRPLA
jgi:hypothetical protein